MGPRVRGDDSEFWGAGVANSFRPEPRAASDQRDLSVGAYRPAFQAFTSVPISTTSGSRMVDGVREKRGAGAGCVTPWRSMNTPRAAMWACLGASDIVSTG